MFNKWRGFSEIYVYFITKMIALHTFLIVKFYCVIYFIFVSLALIN